MTQFKGFKTIKEAKAFVKSQKRGIVLYDKRTPTGRKSYIAKEFDLCVRAGGLDKDTYPYCVEWNV